jgi:protein-tyrosine phosphatase
LERHPSPFAGDPIYRHVPLLNDLLTYEVDPATYAPMLEHNRERIRAGFAALADAPPGGVVVHCHGGRDRTGALVALALSVAGVADETIAEDYARTAGADAEAMRNTMRHVRTAYRTTEDYLRAIGVTQPQITATRNCLRDAPTIRALEEPSGD